MAARVTQRIIILLYMPRRNYVGSAQVALENYKPATNVFVPLPETMRDVTGQPNTNANSAQRPRLLPGSIVQ